MKKCQNVTDKRKKMPNSYVTARYNFHSSGRGIVTLYVTRVILKTLLYSSPSRSCVIHPRVFAIFIAVSLYLFLNKTRSVISVDVIFVSCVHFMPANWVRYFKVKYFRYRTNLSSVSFICFENVIVPALADEIIFLASSGVIARRNR